MSEAAQRSVKSAQQGVEATAPENTAHALASSVGTATKSTPATPPGFYRPADPRDPEAKSGEVHGEGLRWARGPQGTGGPGSWPDWKALTQNPPCHQPKTGFPDGLAFTSHFLPPPPRQGNVFIRGKSPR